MLAYNHIGEKNGIPRLVVAALLDIHERDLRESMREININPEFKNFVSTSHCVYICDNDAEDDLAMAATAKQMVALAVKLQAMKKKKQARGQMRIPLDEKDYDMIVDLFQRGK